VEGNGSTVSGGRVSNAWVMYPGYRDSLSKDEVIPDDTCGAHVLRVKGSGDPGSAHVLSASWRGNGPPRRRRVAGVRAWPATSGLRHCPDTYGWLQQRIFRNGRKPDGATPRAG